MGDPLVFPGRELARLKLSETSSKRLILAIDFGTTYSGVAYCFPGQHNAKPYVVENWPGTGGLKTPKIPTVVEYDKDNTTKFNWGALVQKPSDSIIGVKLLLDPDQALPSHVPSTNVKKIIKALPKLPQKIAADFIRALHAHAKAEITTKIAGTDLDSYTIDYVMSVPAVWSDAAKNATLAAAKEAGIFPVTLIKEPEAAALHTIREQSFELEPQDVIVICDAGGGTVDLVSYEVEKTSPTLLVKEIVPGKGAMVGSLVLNKRFASVLEGIIPDDKWDDFKSSQLIADARKEFDERVKKSFRGDPDKEYYIRLRGAGLDDDPENNLEDGEWCMKADTVSKIFEPVVADILGLIREQVHLVQLKKKNVKAIFLVGGFGESPYLRERVQRDNETIKVAQPTDAWAAIAKGAALSKLPNNAIITSISAVRHYGVEAGFIFDKRIDQGQSTYLHGFDGTTRVLRMDWHINIGDSIGRAEKIKLSFCRSFPQDYTDDDLIFSEYLYESEDKNAPLHKLKGLRVQRNCILVANLQSVDKSNFVQKFGPAKAKPGQSTDIVLAKKDDSRSVAVPYWLINYDLVISFESALMTFSLEIDGETIGSVEAQFKR